MPAGRGRQDAKDNGEGQVTGRGQGQGRGAAAAHTNFNPRRVHKIYNFSGEFTSMSDYRLFPLNPCENERLGHCDILPAGKEVEVEVECSWI